jgi:hypothetical protein
MGLLFAGVGELDEADRSTVLLGDEQLTPGNVPRQFDRPVIPIGAAATKRGGNIGVIVPCAQ